MPKTRFIFLCLAFFLNISFCYAKDLKPLIEAIKDNSNEYVVNAIIEYGADVNQKDEEGHSVLIIAAVYNTNPIIFYELLRKGADIDAKEPIFGHTALFFAARYNSNPEIIDILLSNGADKYQKDILERTPLYYLLRNPHLKESYLVETLDTTK